jgi:CRISPR-associated protein Csx17
MSQVWCALRFPGLRPESLGHYLAGLGLLAATSVSWPEIRGCWKYGHFLLVGDALERAAIEDFVLTTWQPTPYTRWWKTAQRQDTNARDDRHLWQARNVQEAGRVRALDGHIIGNGRNRFNPVLGSGGNIGRRDLERLFQDASTLLRRAPADKRAWLLTTLDGTADRPLPALQSAGTWFVSANKTFNSGQSWYQEGQLSPWSVLLALEGAQLLTGGVGRRLGARSRPYAVFPFVADAPSPTVADEVGLATAEFWAPVWEHPATLGELRAFFARGLAQIGPRAAHAPHEFAVAALAAGVDAGVQMFVRFVLRQTTSRQVYEAIPRERVVVSPAPGGAAHLITPLLSWLDRLPADPRNRRQQGAFRGLRGPVEAALIRLAERPEAPEHWQILLQRLAEAQGRIDRNQRLRDQCHAVPWLPPAWFSRAWPSPPMELLVARAIASVGAAGDLPVLLNCYGVTLDRQRRPLFPGDQRPHRAVWHNGPVLQVLAAVLERRLVDAAPLAPLPLGGPCPCSAAGIAAFLADTLDLAEIGRWVPPLALINWGSGGPSDQEGPSVLPLPAVDGAFLLHALFRPLFHPGPLQVAGAALFPDGTRPAAATVRQLFHLIRQEHWEAAVALAHARYRVAGRTMVLPPHGIRAHGERLAAALLLPMAAPAVQAGVQRWFQPQKRGSPEETRP